MKKLIFSLLTVFVVFSMLVACAPQVAPEKVIETVVVTQSVEKIVQETVQVSVEKMVLAGPIPYPDGAMMAGSRPPKTFDVSDIVEYKAFDTYCESPTTKALADQGVIPAVKDRLPKEPLVWKSGFMSDGIGQYGGIWRAVWAVPIEGWNYDAGAVDGWFGIEANVQEEPLNIADMFLTKNIEPLPELAKSWDWSADGKQLTMHLIEGAKWSDGFPFNADDIMFLWNDNIMDPQVNTWTNASYWTINDQPVKLEKVDDYTILWTFPVSKPLNFLYAMKSTQFSPGPAHILKPFHPKYGGKDYQSYRDALKPDHLPDVTMGPWVPVDYKTDEFLVFRRNPFYYQVDGNGCQLPYMDEVQFTYSKTGDLRTINALAGKGEDSNVEDPAVMDETVLAASKPDAPFRLEWGPETLGFDVELNQSKFAGVQSDRDTAVRELLRDVRFRRALTQGVDRDGLARTLTNGPFFRAWPGGLLPGSPLYDKKAVVYYPFSPDTSKAILADMGLEDTDGDGYLNYASGPLAGKNIELSLDAPEDQSAGLTLGPALVLLWKDIGIKVNYRTLVGTAFTQNTSNATWVLIITRSNQAWATPNMHCKEIAPVTSSFVWHRQGDKPEEYQDFENQLKQIDGTFCLETDHAKQLELISQYNNIATENVYNIGLVIGRYGLILNKYLKNIPIGTTAFLYEYSDQSELVQQTWFDAKDQWNFGEKEIYPGTIPCFESFKNAKFAGCSGSTIWPPKKQ